MSEKIAAKKLSIISGKEAKKALSIGLDRYLETTNHKNKLSEYAGSIEFSDDEFDVMSQELKEDKYICK
jgi:hypothetical protein